MNVLMWLTITLGVIFMVSFAFLTIYVLIDIIKEIKENKKEDNEK